MSTITHSSETKSSLSKAVGLLRIVAERNATGINLTRLARRSRMNIATTHRLLNMLVAEGLLSFDPYSKLYHLGMGLQTLVEADSSHVLFKNIKDKLHDVLEQLANETGDTVFLSVLSCDQSLCIDRVSGAYPVSVSTLDVGARRPLGAGAGSLALLAALPKARQQQAVEMNRERYQRYGTLTADNVRKAVRHCQRKHYAYNNAMIIPEVGAVGVAVFDAQGELSAAVSIAALLSRLKSARRQELVQRIDQLVRVMGFQTKVRL